MSSVHRGVVPPALAAEFMTTELLSHHRASVDHTEFGRSLLLYRGESVHDVPKAIQYLKAHIVGFFLATPLDWGMETRINGDVSKQSIVDIA
jgi:hypothetical protein